MNSNATTARSILEILDSESIQAAWKLFTKALADLGFENVCYQSLEAEANSVIFTSEDWWKNFSCNKEVMTFADYLKTMTCFENLPDGTSGVVVPLLKGPEKSSARVFLAFAGQAERLEKAVAANEDLVFLASSLFHRRFGAVNRQVETGPNLTLSVRNQRLALLTKRQLQVIELLEKGLLNKQIAHELEISLPSVSFHLKSIQERLGLCSTRQIIPCLNGADC